MALDPRYIADDSLDENLVDKDTGAPLAGGYIYFYEDSNRTTPKLVYELSGSPPNYTYSALPNPIQLSATGTPMNAQGDDVAIYYYPYDSFLSTASQQLYYIAVFNNNMVPQFTREAWPNSAVSFAPGGTESIAALAYKPVSSWLVGWDFPLNPTSFLGPSVPAFSSGANTSNYYWDQTIAFQSADNSISFQRADSGALRVTTSAITQFALIQYLKTEARDLLNGPLCVNIAGFTNQTSSPGTVSLYWTTDSSLPSISGSNESLVATLDSNGKPATFNGAWTEVPRGNLGNATFSMGTSVTTEFNDYPLVGWDAIGTLAANQATYFAIVVGFASLPNGATLDFGSISLVPGYIATRPAPKTASQVVLDCAYYYQKSFASNTVPAQNVGTATGEYLYTATQAAALDQRGPTFVFPHGSMLPPGATPTLYNPSANNALPRDETAGADCSNPILSGVTESHFSLVCTGNGSTAVGNWIGFHWTADQRLGK